MAKKRRTIASLSDEHRKLMERADAFKDKAKELESQAEKLALECTALMDAEGIETGGGKATTCKIEGKEAPKIVDFTKLCAFVKKTGNFQLFHRRIGSEAFFELRDNKVKVPGIEVSKFRKFSTQRRKRRGA